MPPTEWILVCIARGVGNKTVRMYESTCATHTNIHNSQQSNSQRLSPLYLCITPTALSIPPASSRPCLPSSLVSLPLLSVAACLCPAWLPLTLSCLSAPRQPSRPASAPCLVAPACYLSPLPALLAPLRPSPARRALARSPALSRCHPCRSILLTQYRLPRSSSLPPPA